MTTVNKDWNKWILISAIKHFKAMADTNSIHFHIPGMKKNTAMEDRFFEFTMSGPIIVQRSKNQFQLTVGISIYYSTDSTTNYQDSAILAGLLVETFTDICVYKYGDGDAYLGRLSLLSKNSINVNDFGVISTDTNIKQGSVDALYTIYLEN